MRVLISKHFSTLYHSLAGTFYSNLHATVYPAYDVHSVVDLNRASFEVIVPPLIVLLSLLLKTQLVIARYSE